MSENISSVQSWFQIIKIFLTSVHQSCRNMFDILTFVKLLIITRWTLWWSSRIIIIIIFWTLWIWSVQHPDERLVSTLLTKVKLLLTVLNEAAE